MIMNNEKKNCSRTYFSDCSDRKNKPHDVSRQLSNIFEHATHVIWSNVFSSRTPQRMSTNVTSMSDPLARVRSSGRISFMSTFLSTCVSVKVEDTNTRRHHSGVRQMRSLDRKQSLGKLPRSNALL